MKARRQARLGDLVVAAFDEAAACTTDPHEVPRLATLAVMDLLRWVRPARSGGPRAVRHGWVADGSCC